MGPLFYREDGEETRTQAFPPFFVYSTNKLVDSEEIDVLYPLLTYDRFGTQGRWQFLQIFNRSTGEFQDETIRRKLTLFPFFFHQESTDPTQNYTAIWPIAGHLVDRLYYQDIRFVLWPIWVKTQRAAGSPASISEDAAGPDFKWRQSTRVDVTTYNVIAPLFHYRTGPGLKGYRALPLFRWEAKEVTYTTDEWGEQYLVPGHRRLTLLWPLFHAHNSQLGTENEEKLRAFLPFYSVLRSPQRVSTSIPAPIGFTITVDHARQYREVGAPWPFIVFTRGEGKQITRIWPFYSRSENGSLESRFILWPVWKYNAIHAETLERQRRRLAWFLYSDTVELNRETQAFRRRVDAWPLFTYTKGMDGRTRFSAPALLETLLPNYDSIDRDWAPLWAVWRSQGNPETDSNSQSLLWNLYRRESSPSAKRVSLLFGLFQYESNPEQSRVKLLFIPIGGANNRNQAGHPLSPEATGSARAEGRNPE